MISFHWMQGLAALVIFGVGLVAGRLWALPPDQALNLTSLLVGIVFGLVGIAVTLWASAHDRQLRFDSLQRDVADIRGAVGALDRVTSQVWGPFLQAIATGLFGTSRSPATLASVVQEPGQVAPTQAAGATDPAERAAQPQQGGETP